MFKESFSEHHKRLKVLRRVGASSAVQDYVLGQITDRGGKATIGRMTINFGVEVLGYNSEELTPLARYKEEREPTYDAFQRAYQVQEVIQSACKQLKEKGYLEIEGWPDEWCNLTKEVKPKQEKPKIDSKNVIVMRNLIEKCFIEMKTVGDIRRQKGSSLQSF